jgi:hypothetical protein
MRVALVLSAAALTFAMTSASALAIPPELNAAPDTATRVSPSGSAGQELRAPEREATANAAAADLRAPDQQGPTASVDARAPDQQAPAPSAANLPAAPLDTSDGPGALLYIAIGLGAAMLLSVAAFAGARLRARGGSGADDLVAQ